MGCMLKTPMNKRELLELIQRWNNIFGLGTVHLFNAGVLDRINDDSGASRSKKMNYQLKKSSMME